MPNSNQTNGRKKQKLERPKLIFVSENKFQIKKAERFAVENNLEFYNYSDVEWATLEEINQYIQEEEISKQIVDLPEGYQTVSSLNEIEADTISKVLRSADGNMVKAARTLKIARATLYRKIEKYGLHLKKQREEEMQKQKKTLKKAA